MPGFVDWIIVMGGFLPARRRRVPFELALGDVAVKVAPWRQ
jgi:hypothetical protein